MTSYAGRFIISRGQECTLGTSPLVSSHVSMKRSSKSVINPGIRESMWEGLILGTSSLVSGELLNVGVDRYLVMSVTSDASSGELAWYGAKTNVELHHYRYVESTDASNNIVQAWSPLAVSVAAYGQIVTTELRQFDPGLLDSSKYVFWIPSSLGLQELDRLVMGENNYQVDAVDDVMLDGVDRVQAGSDVRL